MFTDSNALYSAWFGAMGDAFGTLWPRPGGAAGEAPDGAAALPFPVDQVGKAMDMLGGLLTQMLQSALPLLARGEGGADPLAAFAGQGAEAFERLLAASKAGPAAGADPNFERVFGGLFDAFGLRPTRELEQALRGMVLAGADQQRAQAEYLSLVAQACATGTRTFVRDLQAMAARGEGIDSLVAFVRAWTRAIDGPLHEAMQGERGLQATAKVVRAATAYRSRMQKAVALASDALQLPTRAELDDAYREIQELKRELRRLRKALPAVAAEEGSP